MEQLKAYHAQKSNIERSRQDKDTPHLMKKTLKAQQFQMAW